MLINKMLKRPAPYILVILILAASGLFLYRHLGVDILPNLNYPLINIITHYPGASPQDVEITVTRPLESSVSGLKNLRRVSSVSSQGLSKITCEFVWGTSANMAMQQIYSAISKAKPGLPASVDPVTENIGSTLLEIADYAVTADTAAFSLYQLRNIARYNIAAALPGMEGVGKAEVLGGDREAFVIDPSFFKLGKYNVTLNEIARSVKASNYYGYSGYATRFCQGIPVAARNSLNSVEKINETLVRYQPPRNPVKIKDVAAVSKGALPKRYEVYINGKKGVVISIFKQPGANTLKAAYAVNKKISGLASALPEAVKIDNIYSQAGLISDLTGSLKGSILLGGILVIIILILLLGDLWGGILIAVTIPLSALIMFILLYLFHFSLNVMTLGAIAVGVGMIVDDSIIVFENIFRRRQAGEERLKATRDGLKEIIAPDASGTFTTVAVFLPLLLVSGIAGRLFIPFGFTISVLLLASLFCSVTFIPIVMSLRKNIVSKTKSIGGYFFGFLIKINRALLEFSLKHKAGALSFAVIIFAGSVFLLVRKPVDFLPNIDEGAILCEYILPPDVSFSESKRIGTILESLIASDPDVVRTYLRVGSQEETHQVEGVDRGEILTKLTPRKKRKRNIARIMNDMRKKTDEVPGVLTMYHLPTMEKIDESFSGLPALFGITVFGKDYEVLADYADKIEKTAKDCPYIGTIVNNAVIKTPGYDIKLAAEKLNKFGLTPENVYKEINYATVGNIADYTVLKDRSVPIFLKADGQKTISRPEDIYNLPIRLPDGGYVTVRDIGSLQKRYKINSLEHINFQRGITMIVEIDAPPGAVIKWLKPRLAALNLPEGYYTDFAGQYKSLGETVKSLIFAAGIAVLLIYLIMLFQFNSFRQPFIILLGLPFAVSGGIIALVITGVQFNISAMLGMLALFGVAVNNGIVLLDYTNKLKEKGHSLKEAIIAAMEIRLRPVFLTTFTTFFGLIPIALSTNAQIQQPLAVVVIGGLLFSAFFSLNILPVLYSVFEKS